MPETRKKNKKRKAALRWNDAAGFLMKLTVVETTTSSGDALSKKRLLTN